MEFLLVVIFLVALFVWDKFHYRKRPYVPGQHQAPDLIGDADRGQRE